MTDNDQPVTDNGYAALRDEMQSQYQQLKDAFEQSSKEKDETIAALKEQNESLQRALVRSAFTENPAPVEKSPEELYADRVKEISEKTLSRMKQM